ncbi:MAG: PDZ domain-containing protein [Isosphaerales bacterium]
MRGPSVGLCVLFLFAPFAPEASAQPESIIRDRQSMRDREQMHQQYRFNQFGFGETRRRPGGFRRPPVGPQGVRLGRPVDADQGRGARGPAGAVREQRVAPAIQRRGSGLWHGGAQDQGAGAQPQNPGSGSSDISDGGSSGASDGASYPTPDSGAPTVPNGLSFPSPDLGPNAGSFPSPGGSSLVPDNGSSLIPSAGSLLSDSTPGADRPEQLPTPDSAPRPKRYLGIDQLQVVDGQGQRGIQIVSVHKGSVAEKAGLERGDLLLFCNGYVTQNVGDLPWIIANTTDSTLRLHVRNVRDGLVYRITVELD